MVAPLFSIPTDFADFPAAFAHLRQNPIPYGTVGELRLESGYRIEKGVTFEHDDFSRVRITSVDPVVSLETGFVGCQVSTDPFEANSLFVAHHSKAPRLECLIDMGGLGGCGLVLSNNSEGFVQGACGVRNAGAYGLYVKKQSRCIAANADFRLSGWGNRVTTNSMLEAPQCNFSGARSATYLGTNNVANLDVSRGSLVYITGTAVAMTDLTGGRGHGLAVRRSFVSATFADCSFNDGRGLNIGAGSVVTLNGGKAASCGVHGIACDGSRVEANSSTVTGAGQYNLYADSGGEITARNSMLTGAALAGARAANGSRINVSGSDCRRAVSASSSDIWVSGGSMIHAVGATGGTNITPLALNIAGLIFK